MRLELADGLALPVAAATETFLLVGKRGSGKSSTATRFAEQLVRAKVPIAVLDPVDVWWGLKAGADGKAEGGLEVYVFGGEHAQLPLEPTAGVLMADTLVDHRINAVFVIRQFSNRDRARFVSDFAEQLFKRNRDVLHLFCEEAHEVMPQNPYGGDEEMLGRMVRIVKLGRTSGVGVSAITQRPASLNKNVTTQCEVLVAHRILGAQDRNAVDDWIKYHRLQEQRAEFLASLGELKTGEAWVWAPDFPEDKPIGLRRVQVLMPETFDSRRTPKAGERRREPKALAPVDLEKLGEKMAATRERAKANDPAELRAELAKAKAEISRMAKLSPQAKEVLKRIEVPMLKDAQIKRIEVALDRLDKMGGALASVVGLISGMAKDLNAAFSAASLSTVGNLHPGRVPVADGAAVRAATPAASLDRPSTAPSRARARDVGAPVRSGEPRVTDGEHLTRMQQRSLDILLMLEELGHGDAPKIAIAAWRGVRPGGSFSVDLARLLELGLIDPTGSGRVRLTEAGRARASREGAPQTIDELHERIAKNLGARERDLLRVIIEAHPDALTAAQAAERLGIKPGGSFSTYVAHLRDMGVIAPRGELAATDILFPMALVA